MKKAFIMGLLVGSAVTHSLSEQDVSFKAIVKKGKKVLFDKILEM